MADYHVRPVQGSIDAEVSVPGSKSITNRALLISALSDNICTLNGVQFSDDTSVFAKALMQLGIDINIFDSDKSKKRLEINGCSGSMPKKEENIYLGSAGTAARFITALCAVSDGVYKLDASCQMKGRPMKPLFDALCELGAEVQYHEIEGCFPVTLKGCFFENKDTNKIPSEISIDSNVSTQFLSALLLVAPSLTSKTQRPFKIHAKGDRGTGAYVKMTKAVLEKFFVNIKSEYEEGQGVTFTIPHNSVIRARQYDIEPDVSAACYFYAAAAITGGRVVVKGVHEDSLQGDIRFLDILNKCGCEIIFTEKGAMVQGPPDKRLKGIEVDMRDFSDQTMTLAAIAPYFDSDVIIKNVAHIRKQESDRLHAIATELSRMGVKVIEYDDGIKITPGEVKSTTVKTYNDHRIAMAFAITGLRTPGIIISNYECCNKTFRNFFEVLEEIYN